MSPEAEKGETHPVVSLPDGRIRGPPPDQERLKIAPCPPNKVHSDRFSPRIGLRGARGPLAGLWEAVLGPLGRVLGLLGASFGPLGGLLGRLGGLLGASWSLFGASWGLLGTSWGPLGISLGPLGASWGPLGAEGSIFQFFVPLLGLSWARLGTLFAGSSGSMTTSIAK